ncbi:MAG: ATP-binding cassette domain-containing protein, partial [Geminicoccaceae bacterium]|nr:ATP-binding cassette domain-containing protein [Geminicoccaceae bacterium]
MLEVEGLTKRFGGFTAVKDVSFRVEEGEILGLIGPNGSGKSTTFNCIAGALAPTAGSIRFSGEEIGGLSPVAICHKGIARTFQIPRPFKKLSIFENVLVAAYYGHGRELDRRTAERHAIEALELVRLPADRSATVDQLGAAGLK